MLSKGVLRSRLRKLPVATAQYTTQQIVAMLAQLLQAEDRSHAVLLYDAVEQWREVDVSSLPELLPGMSFNIIPHENGTAFPAKKYDAILVPLFGFSRDGYRLGHGGGWYDRFLATQPQALKIGVGYERSLVDFTPESHDIPMDVIITEKRQRDFRVQ